MKILFINPPRSHHNAILHYAPNDAKRFIHKKLIGPPLGLLTIATSVSKDHDVTFLDMKGEYDLHPDTVEHTKLARKWIEKYKPNVVAVTFISSEYYYGIDILRVAKDVDFEITTIAGGLHVTLCPHDFKDPAVDIAISGEATPIFNKCITAIDIGRPLDTIKGIILRQDAGHFSTGSAPAVYSATKDFVLPDRDLVKPWISTYRVGNKIEPSTYLFTSLGCPYKCSFCSIWPQYDGRYFQRDVESIIQELKLVIDYPIVRFADANTVVNIDFIRKLFMRIKQEGIKKEYIMDIRFDTVVNHPDLIAEMANSGLKVVICGFESFRQKELERYNKSSDATLIQKAVDIFDENNIMVRGNYVISPDYSRDDFLALADYAFKHKVVYAGYTILTPMPGTTLYNQMRVNIVDHDLSKYNFFNCVLKSRLPLEEFYRSVGNLWLIKKGNDVI